MKNLVIHTELEELKIRIYNRLEFTEILKSCGFKNIRIIKAFDHAVGLDEDDELLFMNAESKIEHACVHD